MGNDSKLGSGSVGQGYVALLTEAECEFLVSIPRSLRRERGWSGARSVGMVKLIEERIGDFFEAKRAQGDAIRLKVTREGDVG